MIFETTVEKLLYAVECSERITTKNTTLPTLSNILILVSDKIVKVRSTNLSIGVEFELIAKIENPGVVVVDGRTLTSFLSTIKRNSKIKISQQGSLLSLVGENNKTSIKTYSHEDFPTLPVVKGVDIKIPKNQFIKGVKNTVFSAAVSDIKPEISSLYLSGSGNTLLFVSTDSFRLAEKKETIKNSLDFPGIIIPAKNITEIIRILEGASEDVTLTISENQISFKSEGVYITSKIISGSFPDYKQIIPKTFTTEVVLLKQELLETLKAANIFSDKFNQITLSINPNKKKFECFAKNPDVGDYSGAISGALSGEEVSVTVNQRYLVEVLPVISQDSVSISFNGASKPLVLRGVGDTSFTYLLMPMNK